MSTGASLLKGSVFRTVDLLFVVGSAFLVTPWLVHAAGDRVFGFWTLVMTVVGYYGLLDLGLSSAAARYMSQALGKGSGRELDRVAGTTLVLFTGAAAAVVLAAGLTAWACPLFLHVGGDAALLRRLLLLVGAAAAVQVRAKVYMGLLMADLKYDLLSAVSIGRTAVYAAGVFLALRAGFGIEGAALAMLGANVLQYGALLAACRLACPDVRVSVRAFDRARVREMLGYGSKTLVCQLGDVLRFRLDSVVIASFLGAALVTPYAVGSRLIEAFQQLVYNSVSMMLPVFSQLEARGDGEGIRSGLLKVTKLTTILSVFIGASIIFYGRAFILRWMGPGYDPAYRVAVILCVAFVIELPQTPGIQLLYGLSRHRVYAVLSVCEGAANLALSVLFLKRFGIYGVALGTAVEHALFKLLVQPIYICAAAAVPVRVYLVRTIFGAAAKTIVPLGAYFFLAARFVEPSYGALAACLAVQTALFAPLAYFLILGRSEREAVSGALRALAPGRKREALA